uniref:Uncharacterized protein n=1 Tax=Panagrolaimus davidi TaxID=227884 RepID=A0A914PKS6_9BILA
MVALGIQGKYEQLGEGVSTHCGEILNVSILFNNLHADIQNETIYKAYKERLDNIELQFKDITNKNRTGGICSPITKEAWLAGMATLLAAFWAVADCIASFITMAVSIHVPVYTVNNKRRVLFISMLANASGAIGTYITMLGMAKFLEYLPNDFILKQSTTPRSGMQCR